MGKENRIKITIPDGHTAKVENNTVIFEPKTAKFKKGDFVGTTLNKKSSFVYRDEDCGFFGINYDGELKIGYYSHANHNLRYLTDSEKQTLLDKLHEVGKDWDAEKYEIVDCVWEPKAGDSIWSINAKGLINEWTFSGRGSFVPDSMDFRTPELAEAALESLKQSKHY